MFLFLHNYRTRPQTALKRARYKYRPSDDDYILLDGTSGRYHAKILDKNTIKLHYDIFVEDRHWAPWLPMRLTEERKRISRVIRFTRYRELGEDEFKGLVKRYSVYN